ncbi:MAG TPA: hypothetical protein VMI53_09545 [Opitutaceae bacterium]|nr:hypothetical protein [Opitutaceae bacterium]
MNQPSVRFALLLGLSAAIPAWLRAQEGPPPEQYEPPPPVGVDASYFTPPKNTISIGFRTMTGPRVSVSSSFGIVPSQFDPGNANDSSITTRVYADGGVFPDTRTDSNGNPITPDGRTNTWNYQSASQLTPDGNGVAMHTYSAVIDGTNPQKGRADTGTGFELTLDRDFGWHVGKVQIHLMAGLGGNDIHYILTKFVPAEVTTLTDTYSLYAPTLDPTTGDYTLSPAGAKPSGPVTSGTLAFPSSTTDLSDNSTDNSTLLDSQPNQGNDPNTPSSRSVSAPQHTTNEVTDQWHIKGAYFTFRAGPKIIVPFTDKFHVSVSTGPALIYAGTTFSVVQTINTPSVNTTSTVSDGYSTVLPAYFADADVEYYLTDRTGFYAGAIFQTSTSYDQSIQSENGAFHTKIDFSDGEEGVRMGVNFKF